MVAGAGGVADGAGDAAVSGAFGDGAVLSSAFDWAGALGAGSVLVSAAEVDAGAAGFGAGVAGAAGPFVATSAVRPNIELKSM
jgi:hypothetical protein